MNIADHRPQDGQFSLRVRGREIDVRVATIATGYGEMAVLRILDKSFALLSLSELGFLPGSLEQYEHRCRIQGSANGSQPTAEVRPYDGDCCRCCAAS